MSRWWVLPLLIGLFSGCLDGAEPESDDVALPSPHDALLQAAGVAPGNLSDARPWWLAAAVGNAQESVAGFRFTLPKDAARSHPDVPGWSGVPLEVVLLGEGRGATLLSFVRFEGEEAHSLAVVTDVPLHVRSKFTPAFVTDEDARGPAEGFVIVLDASAAGEEIGLVVGMEGVEGTSFGVALRLLDEYPDAPVEPQTLEDFLTQGPPMRLAPTGTGAGFHVPVYLDINVGFVTGLLGIEAWSQDVVVEDRLPVDVRPAATVRDVTLGSTFDTAEGATLLGMGLYLGARGAADWSFEVDSFGQRVSDAELWLGADALASSLVLGIPYYAIQGEGEGGSTARLDLTVANTDEVEIVLLLHFEYGASLTTLLGVPLAPMSSTYDGLVAQQDGDDLILRGPVEVRMLGALPET